MTADPISTQIAAWIAALTWSYAFVVVVPVLIAHAWLQLVKDRRRKQGLPAYDALALCGRGAPMAALVAFPCALFAEWPIPRAGLGAVLVGAGYVVILICVEFALRKRAPELADRVIGDDATEVAPFDGQRTLDRAMPGVTPIRPWPPGECSETESTNGKPESL